MNIFDISAFWRVSIIYSIYRCLTDRGIRLLKKEYSNSPFTVFCVERESVITCDYNRFFLMLLWEYLLRNEFIQNIASTLGDAHMSSSTEEFLSIILLILAE